MKHFIALLMAVLLFSPNLSEARPSVREQVFEYPVYGANSSEVQRYMDQNGPNGSWGWTDATINWTGNCNVSVKMEYTLPKLADRSIHSQSFLAAWDAMVVAIRNHQQLFALSASDAARLIERRNCNGTDRIVRDWRLRDETINERTDEGAEFGIYLP